MTKEEQAKLQIDFSKIGADEQKYFDLFDKHIPENVTGNVLIYDISNLGCIYKILQKNPEAKYFIYGNQSVNKGLKLMIGEFNVRFLDDTFDVYNINNNMKFDLVIMNPPYQKNLHLKILAEAIKHLKDDDSVCVNLSPVRWLQDPLVKYKNISDLKRFEESVAKHIESLETITTLQAQNVFNGTIMCTDLGIYTCRKDNTHFDYENHYANPILNKCLDYISTHNPDIETNKQDGWRVRMPVIISGRGGGSGDRSKHYKYWSFGKLLAFNEGKNEEGKWWYDCYMHNQHTKTTPYITSSIKFNSKNEAENFIHQFDTLFGKYITDLLGTDVHVSPIQVLWLSDAINPRTGLKGYEGEWTDEDLYKYFNITKAEQKIIEETMAKYK